MNFEGGDDADQDDKFFRHQQTAAENSIIKSMSRGDSLYQQTNSKQKKRIVTCALPASALICAGAVIWAWLCLRAKNKTFEDVADEEHALYKKGKYQSEFEYNLSFLLLLVSISGVQFVNSCMLLVRMPRKAGCRSCLIYIFITFRVVFSIWYAAMVVLMYFLMGYTVYAWFEYTKVKGLKGDEAKLTKEGVTDINSITFIIIEIFLCLVAAVQILFLIIFPIVICRYVATRDDSFCKVLCSRGRGFCKYVGNAVCDYYYPMAVIEEEEDYVGDIDLNQRASENKQFNLQQKIDDFIESRKKKFSSF